MKKAKIMCDWCGHYPAVWCRYEEIGGNKHKEHKICNNCSELEYIKEKRKEKLKKIKGEKNE